MKRILFLLALTAVLLSCGRNAYTINGIFTTDDGTDVYLIDSDLADNLFTPMWAVDGHGSI